MIPEFLCVTIFILQGFLMILDEGIFHRHREMPKWERVGHPLDTVTVLIPFLMTLCLPAREPWTGAFLAFAIVSCAFIVKDEWVHARLCGGGEQTLHAALFVLHPFLFIAAWSLWKSGSGTFLVVQTVLIVAFLLHQIFYWNGPWARVSRGGT